MSSYSNRDVLIKFNQRCEQQEITTCKTLLYWDKYFHKIKFFTTHADFEVDNEVDNCHVGNETNNICKHPVSNG